MSWLVFTIFLIAFSCNFMQPAAFTLYRLSCQTLEDASILGCFTMLIGKYDVSHVRRYCSATILRVKQSEGRRLCTTQHGVTYQKIGIFSSTTVRTSNFMCQTLCNVAPNIVTVIVFLSWYLNSVVSYFMLSHRLWSG
jgi:hypothetical protein